MKERKLLSAKELAANTNPGRVFDQVTVVVKDLETVKGKIVKYYKLDKWIDGCLYGRKTSSAWMQDVEIVLLEVGSENDAWKMFSDRYSEGIACTRENVSAEKYASELERYKALGVEVAGEYEDSTGKTAILNTLDRIGGFLAIHFDASDRQFPAEELRNDRKFVQINVTTPDVEETCAQLCELLQIGPFGIGNLGTSTTKNSFIRVDGKRSSEEWKIRLGMCPFCSIEWEVIQPVTGRTVYKKFTDRRGVGYHHFKEKIPLETQEQILQAYEDNGMPLCIKGTFDVTTFAYLDSEEDFKFYVEMGDCLIPQNPPAEYDEKPFPAE